MEALSTALASSKFEGKNCLRLIITLRRLGVGDCEPVTFDFDPTFLMITASSSEELISCKNICYFKFMIESLKKYPYRWSLIYSYSKLQLHVLFGLIWEKLGLF